MRVALGPLSEFGERPKVKVVGRRHFLVVKIGGEVYVAQSLCPHARWPLGFAGRCFKARGGEPYVVCAIHGGVWSLRTGSGTVEGRPAPPLKVYETRVEDGVVYVQL